MSEAENPVSVQDVLDLLENGFRNVALPPLSADDFRDIHDALAAFAARHPTQEQG